MKTLAAWLKKGIETSCHSKETLENMLEDVINELDLSSDAITKHGQIGTTPAQLLWIFAIIAWIAILPMGCN